MSVNPIIRNIKPSEYRLLEDFLYEAIFIPQGVEAPPRSIIDAPELQLYIADFGKQPADTCLVAEVDGKVVGAAWARIMPDYGHIDNRTPSLSVSLLSEYRQCGIGTTLFEALLATLKTAGYKQASLSVQKANYASAWYLRLGFQIVKESNEEYVMVYQLNG